MKVLILARGGSKGIPDKNIKYLDGLPLIAYPINAARQSKFVDDVYVSTDSEKIALIAERYGAKTIRRPTHLAEDNSLDIDAFRHAVPLMDNPEEIIHLRATTPLVNKVIIDKAVTYYLENKSVCTSMRSAHKTPESAYKFFKSSDKFWRGLFDNMEGEYYNKGRQELPDTYKPNGCVDIVKPSVFMNSDSFHGENILAFETPVMIEVDSLEEFQYLEYLINKK